MKGLGHLLVIDVLNVSQHLEVKFLEVSRELAEPVLENKKGICISQTSAKRTHNQEYPDKHSLRFVDTFLCQFFVSIILNIELRVFIIAFKHILHVNFDIWSVQVLK